MTRPRRGHLTYHSKETAPPIVVTVSFSGARMGTGMAEPCLRLRSGQGVRIRGAARGRSSVLGRSPDIDLGSAGSHGGERDSLRRCRRCSDRCLDDDDGLVSGRGARRRAAPQRVRRSRCGLRGLLPRAGDQCLRQEPLRDVFRRPGPAHILLPVSVRARRPLPGLGLIPALPATLTEWAAGTHAWREWLSSSPPGSQL